jgi:putative transposase
MGFKYRINSNEEIYFLTMTVVDWVDVFTRPDYSLIMIDSLRYCQAQKGLELYAYCIMSNHVHLIASAREEHSLSDILRDLKKFTSKKIVKAIEEGNESRKAWLLNRFEYRGRINPKIKDYQFWQEGNHPVALLGIDFTKQKLDYIHENPVKAMIVSKAEDYVFSSARNYAGEQGILEVSLLF